MIPLACRSVFAALILLVVAPLSFGETVLDETKPLKDSATTKKVVQQKVTPREAPPKQTTPQETTPQETTVQLSKSAPSVVPSASSNANSTVMPTVGSGVKTTDPTMVIVGLLLVIILIVGSAWLMRRVGGLKMLGGQSMSVVAALSVGSREKVVLIDVEGQQILVGVAPGRVSHIQTFDEPVVDLQRPKGNDFSSTIKKLLAEKNAHSESNEKEMNA